jgi:uncharacterized protein (DUF1015 family)
LTGSTRCRLQLEPFRGVRYDPGRYRRLPQVTAPPYDVIGRDDAVALEHADPHNIVRAILPREDDRHPDRYAAAAALWRTWLDDGTLTVDDTPSLYVYEQVGTPGIAGVIGAVRLHGPGCGAACTVVLPHEDVMPGPVTDRLDLLSSTQANLEPILLAYEGDGSAAAVVAAILQRRPLVSTYAAGHEHRLWSLDDPRDAAVVMRDVAAGSALIADGHHRYASYLAYQEKQRAAGHGAGPWDFGLAMLVDVAVRPLDLGAIDRVVAGLALEPALGQAADHFVISVSGMDEPSPEPARGSIVLTDGTRRARLVPRPQALDLLLPAGISPERRSLDVTVLHDVLLGSLWQVAERDITYVHDRLAAVRDARAASGVAALLAPVGLDQVFAVARRGELMPRKTTSFGPKPRSGLVMRSLLG